MFGSGNADADLMFVGEAPGANEDRLGLPFVGQAGKLLDKLLDEIGLERADVFICNTLKCRPPGNRDPQPNEIESCHGYLQSQVELIEPKLICTLGNFATKLLRADTTGISRLHGQAEERIARRSAGPALSALPPGRGAVHAAHARGAAGRLPAHPRAARPRGARATATPGPDTRAGARRPRARAPARTARARTGARAGTDRAAAPARSVLGVRPLPVASRRPGLTPCGPKAGAQPA